jgi:hypothetical protein
MGPFGKTILLRAPARLCGGWLALRAGPSPKQGRVRFERCTSARRPASDPSHPQPGTMRFER